MLKGKCDISSRCGNDKLLGTVIVVAFGGWFALKGYVSTADIVGFIMFLGLFISLSPHWQE